MAASSAHGRSRKPQMSAEQRAEVRQAFELFVTRDDTESMSKRINARELTVAIQALGFEPKKERVARYIEQYNSQGDDTIDADAFEAIITDLLGADDDRDLLEHVFAMFDEDADGFITLSDVERIAQDLNDGIPSAELSSMIAQASSDQHHDRVSVEDFLRIMHRSSAQ
eukprot:c7659_g1_i2.p1 GENE.c7659_g1_i2~~c7659_g1_i2.p1  ORF type:complete len:169 (+),score=29.60 c7659_g1_i2:53-559(+)